MIKPFIEGQRRHANASGKTFTVLAMGRRAEEWEASESADVVIAHAHLFLAGKATQSDVQNLSDSMQVLYSALTGRTVQIPTFFSDRFHTICNGATMPKDSGEYRIWYSSLPQALDDNRNPLDPVDYEKWRQKLPQALDDDGNHLNPVKNE